MEKIHSILKHLYRSLVQYCFKLFYGNISYEQTNSFNENIIINIARKVKAWLKKLFKVFKK